MPDVTLPFPEEGKNDKETIRNLTDCIWKLRKELEFLLYNLDSENVLEAKKAIIAEIFAGTITTDQLIAGNAKISLALIEDIIAENIVTNTFVTQTLYADKAYIAELAVDWLETSNKVQRYRDKDISEMNFIRIYKQFYDFITAKVQMDPYQHWETYPQSPVLTADYPYQFIQQFGAAKTLYVLDQKIWHYNVGTIYYLNSNGAYKKYSYDGSTWVFVKEEIAGNFGLAIAGSDFIILQNNCDIYTSNTFTTVFKTKTTTDTAITGTLKDRYGKLLYWTDSDHLATTYTVTDYPVYVYEYDEQIKMRFSFAYDSVQGEYVPKIIMGLGTDLTGATDNGKAFIYKDTTGLLLKYIKEVSGEEVALKLGENGIEGIASGSSDETTGPLNLYVGYYEAIAGTGATAANTNVINGTGTNFTTSLAVGDMVYFNGEVRKVGSIASNTVLYVDKNFTYSATTRPIYKFFNGNDSNDGLGNNSAHALATIEAAINKIPAKVNHSVNIFVAPFNYEEYLYITSGKSGAGSITITGHSDLECYAYFQSITIRNCQPRCSIRYITIKMDDDYCSFSTSNIDLSYVKSNGSNADDGFVFSENTVATISSCDVSNKANAIVSKYGAQVISLNNSGTGNTCGLYARNGGEIYKSGTQPAGVTAELVDTGGDIVGEKRGISTSRPTSAYTGYQFFDTTLNKPIWYIGTGWVDSSGTSV